MSFKYDYIPAEKLQSDVEKLEVKILAEGPAHFVIKKIFDKDKQGMGLTTRDGIPKIRVLLTCTDVNHIQGAIWHDISAKMPWAIKTLCDAVGLPMLYRPDGVLDTHKLVGLEGQCILDTRPAEGQYEAKTVIKQYLPHPAGAGVGFEHQLDTAGLEEDDDIPF
jgi:hypothetical protein